MGHPRLDNGDPVRRERRVLSLLAAALRKAGWSEGAGRRQGVPALFAAADVLQLGFVSGVPPYVYVDRLRLSRLAAGRVCAPGESTGRDRREALAPQ
jgi:hypothetical protein